MMCILQIVGSVQMIKWGLPYVLQKAKFIHPRSFGQEQPKTSYLLAIAIEKFEVDK